MLSAMHTTESHQRYATVYYYVKEPGKTSGEIGVSSSYKQEYYGDRFYLAVDDYTL